MLSDSVQVQPGPAQDQPDQRGWVGQPHGGVVSKGIQETEGGQRLQAKRVVITSCSPGPACL